MPYQILFLYQRDLLIIHAKAQGTALHPSILLLIKVHHCLRSFVDHDLGVDTMEILQPHQLRMAKLEMYDLILMATHCRSVAGCPTACHILVYVAEPGFNNSRSLASTVCRIPEIEACLERQQRHIVFQ